MSAKRNILAAALAVGAVCAVLTGCGGDTDDSGAPIVRPVSVTNQGAAPFQRLTGRQILDRAETAMKAAPSLTLQEDGTEHGRSIHAKVVVTKAGRCAAVLRDDQDEVQLIGTGSAFYLKADAGYWQAAGGPDGDEMARALAGKWLKLPPKSVSRSGVGSLCDLTEMIDGMAQDDGAGTITKAHPTTLDGRPVVPLIHAKPDETTTVYVAASGKPYVLKAVTPSGDSPTTEQFTDYGRVPRISAPPASQTVDIGSFGNADTFSI